MEMTRIDFSPLFRNTVGFDRFMTVADAALRSAETAASYPPYNIEKLGDDDYRISMAVAGFSDEDIDVTIHDNRLTVTGRAKENSAETSFLYRGIAGRAFERSFELAEHIKAVQRKDQRFNVNLASPEGAKH
eukprot:TRINITY_DN21433_c0_g1_i1.p2 TRINITY_DN21433_c0_g1~~TRINITY_DN21433_c0_g1_i1.p2  ORF type:complete len:132 (+),score=20.42 TRINITY_DN21433_c0_g1_i1:96-491(+)